MSTKALVLGIVGTGCVVAAGAGGFVAVRMASGDRAEGAALTATAPSRTEAPAPDTTATETKPQTSPASSAPSASSKKIAAASEPAMPAKDQAGATATTESAQAVTTSATATPVVADTPPVQDPVTSTPPPPVTDVAPPPAETKVKFDELTVKEESVIGIRLDSAISSDTARLEDKVTARVTRDVTVNGRTAIASGARLEGYVSAVDRGGKFKGPAKLSIRFTSLVLADNTRIPIQTEALSREGDSPGNEAAAKVGASSVIGAVIGGLIGGKKGAAVGAGAGAGAGTAAVAAGDRNSVTLPAGAALTVKLTQPVTVVIERESHQ
jgi:hypothetical protein